MKPPARKHLCILSAAACLIAVGAFSAPAFASGLTLHLSPPPSAIVGHPTVMKATGTIPLQDLEFPYWFSLDAISTSVTTTCPSDAFEGSQLANSTGGAIIVLTQHEVPDATGKFTIPVGLTPSAPGSVLLCGYTDDGAADTLASASLILNIKSAGSSGHASSGRGAIVAQAASAVRSCRAVLSRSQSRPCIRHALAHAKGRCRRLHARKSRKQCLRAVRHIAHA